MLKEKYKLDEYEKILVSASKKIRAERIGLNLTQKEFAEFVDITHSSYMRYEQSGQISFESYIKILIKLNKQEQFSKFLDGFEFDDQKERAFISDKNKKFSNFINPIIAPNKKYIILDKDVFGAELFYSVEDGHKYEVNTFINIVLNSWDDKRLMQLLKYFGEKRMKPYILKQKDIKLLKAFNRHIKSIKRLK